MSPNTTAIMDTTLPVVTAVKAETLFTPGVVAAALSFALNGSPASASASVAGQKRKLEGNNNNNNNNNSGASIDVASLNKCRLQGFESMALSTRATGDADVDADVDVDGMDQGDDDCDVFSGPNNGVVGFNISNNEGGDDEEDDGEGEDRGLFGPVCKKLKTHAPRLTLQVSLACAKKCAASSMRLALGLSCKSGDSSLDKKEVKKEPVYLPPQTDRADVGEALRKAAMLASSGFGVASPAPIVPLPTDHAHWDVSRGLFANDVWVVRLYRILMEGGFGAARWLPSGDAFEILSQDIMLGLFGAASLPWTHWLKTLSEYRFHQVSPTVYSHPNFRSSHPYLLSTMRRIPTPQVSGTFMAKNNTDNSKVAGVRTPFQRTSFVNLSPSSLRTLHVRTTQGGPSTTIKVPPKNVTIDDLKFLVAKPLGIFPKGIAALETNHCQPLNDDADVDLLRSDDVVFVRCV